MLQSLAMTFVFLEHIYKMKAVTHFLTISNFKYKYGNTNISYRWSGVKVLTN